MDATLRIALLFEKGKRRIMSSGDMLTAAELSQLMARSADEQEVYLCTWLREGRIFAIGHAGTDYFPIYAFDACAGHQPVAALKDIIEVLATRKDAWSMALWFGSSSSYLGGRQPKEALRTDPGDVLDAANDEVGEILHG